MSLFFRRFCGSPPIIDTSCSDATLVTQRLYFAQTPHEHRHVLGWYRMLTELKEHNIGVIAVFDGKERSQAKQSEVSWSCVEPLVPD